MENNQPQINIPMIGMDRDSHPSRIKDNSYTFAKNISLEDTSGNGLPMVQNEPSNLLCHEVSEGNNIIGFKYEPSLRKTFIFTTNVLTGVSEIGYISQDSYFISENGEEVYCNCEPKIEIGTPLEEITQSENCDYTLLISDGCTQANKCLNFSINHPIKNSNIVFKNEQCGKRIYWTDGFNPPRYLDLDELAEGDEGIKWKTNRYFHKGALVCKQEIELEQTCINCDALKVFPDFSIPCIEVEAVTSGGNLYEGTYEFFLAFCDDDGNEISNYYSHTFPVPIFNYDDATVDSWDAARQTSYGVNLSISYLGNEFSFFKLACLFRSAQGQVERAVDLGVFPITQTSVAVSSITHAKEISLNSLLGKKQEVEVVDKIAAANGYLFMGGLTSKVPLNLQPIVSLMGPFVKWTTLITNENAYKDPVFSQNFRSYMRDEVYPLSITFGYDDGTESNDFILINRKPFSNSDYQSLGITSGSYPDLLQVVTTPPNPKPSDWQPTTTTPASGDKNVKSLLKTNLACFDTDRIYRWQYYNTALNLGPSLKSKVNVEIDLSAGTSGLMPVDSESSCSTQDLNGLNIINDLSLQIDGDYQFFQGTPAEYLNSHFSDFSNPSYQFYSALFHEYLKLSRYNNLGCFETLSNTSSNCNNFNPVPNGISLEFSEAIFSNLVPTMLDFSNYTYHQLDYNEIQFSGGLRTNDIQISDGLGLSGYPQLQLRLNTNSGYTCNTSISVLKLNEIDTTSTNGYILKNLGTTEDNENSSTIVFNNYTSNIISDTYDYIFQPIFESAGSVIKIEVDTTSPKRFKYSSEKWKVLQTKQKFSQYISKNAQWFKVSNLDNYPYLQINFKSLSSVPVGGNNNTTTTNNSFVSSFETDVSLNRIDKVRMSIFDGCATTGTTKAAIHTVFFNITDNPLIDIKSIISGLGLSTTQPYYVVFDCPIQRLRKQKVSFNRRYHIDSSIQENSIPQGNFIHMEKVGTGQGTYYRALNFGSNDNPANSCIDPSVNMNPIAWSSSGNYTELGACAGVFESTYVPPPAPVEDGYLWTCTTLENSLLVTQRGKEVDYYTVDIDAVITKTQRYTKTCYYKNIDGMICDWEAFENGIFAYHESTEHYPDNSNLFNASALPIKISESLVNSSIAETLGGSGTDFDIFSGVSFKKLFRLNFGTQSSFVEDDLIDFSCKPIRHFKFPDNTISPFIFKNNVLGTAETYIHPLGVSLDNEVVNTFLNLAVKTKLITREQRDSIVYFKINRGYRGVNKTVLSKGVLSDMIKYTDLDGKENYYSNFPFNSLNSKELLKNTNNSTITHQHNKKGNNRFSFISPEIMMGESLKPTEVKVDGYVYGKAFRQADEVLEHAKMVVLSKSAVDLAYKLGKAEATFELVMSASEALIQAAPSFFMTFGFVVGLNVAGMIMAGIGSAAIIALKATEFDRKFFTYSLKWLEIFKNAGKGANFAYYLASSGTYNNFTSLTTSSIEQLRGINMFKTIKEGTYPLTHDVTDLIEINNIDRERSMYLYLGSNVNTDGILYSDQYINIDDSNKEPSIDGVKRGEEMPIANMYGGLKIYNPAQYGRIHNIMWVKTPGCFYLKEKEVLNLTFGGDIFLSRFTFKKKFNFFLVSMLNQSNFTPFKYSMYFNVGKAKYFIDYDTEVGGAGASYGLPYYESIYNLQFKQEHGKYVDYGRFYHYEYGFNNHLIESETNCWNRVALRQPKDNFYPNFPDYMKFTQENFVSIRDRELFLYNRVYSNEGVKYTGRFLPDSYDPTFYNCVNNSPSGIIRSQQDNSEKRKSDPWLAYKALDFDNFKASYGKFISLRGIESEQLLAYFEHKLVLLNKIDEIRERITPENVAVGQGIFTTRPIEFFSTDNGYGGTQHSEIISTEFGHFHVDARRGQVFLVNSNGQGMTEITDGMRNWFKEHLPFKILKGGIENLSDLDLDNNFKGIGIALGWDSRFKRLFLTKLDYIVNPSFRGSLEYKDVPDDNSLINTKIIVDKVTGEEVKFSNREIFTPCHFTLAYSPMTKTWISYYSFYPNFYISYDNYFRTGLNEFNNVEVSIANKVNDGILRTGIWSHLLTNKSYGVFYGKKFPWSIEVVSKEQYVNKQLTNVEYWLDTIRYHNEYDYALNTEIGFDKAIIYNNYTSSGNLNLITKEKNNRFQVSQYPKINSNSSDILTTYDEGKWSFNDFYDRTHKLNNNVPLWKYDFNSIDKVINDPSISYTQRWLDRVKGDYFLIRFEGGNDTRYKQIFKWLVPKDSILV